MSFELYANWWIVSKQNLEHLMREDAFIKQIAKPMKKREVANELMGGLYAKYSILVQQLDTCLDQMCQVQRRFTSKKLVDAAAIRLQELGEELRKIDLSEFHYIDGKLVEFKLIPHDIEILHPALFSTRPLDVEDMWRKIQQGERIYVPPPPPPPEAHPTPSTSGVGSTAALHAALEHHKEPEPPPPPPPEEEPPKPQEEEDAAKKAKKVKKPRAKEILTAPVELTAAEEEANRRKGITTAAIQLIQNHERRRQGLLYWLEWNVKYQLRHHMKNVLEPPDPELVDAAVRKIQAAWRGYSARSYLAFRERKRRLLIGMTEESWKSTKEFEKLEENLEKRRDLFEQNLRKYIEAHLTEKARIVRVVAPRLMEDIGDEIREWFFQWYTRAKNFDKYPPPEKGGTIVVIRGETMTPEQWLDEVERKRREKVKNAGRDMAKERAEKEKKQKLEAEKKKKEAEKKKKEEEKKKKKKRKPSDFEYELEATKCTDVYHHGQVEYHKLFKERDILENPAEEVYMDIIQEEKYYENQLEVRAIVDEMMRIELELLEAALERDRAKLRKGKGKKGKKKKGKGKKKKKGKKGKKDMTAKRTTEDLFQELVDAGVIRTYPQRRLSEFRGDFSYANWELRNHEFDPPPTLGDVRQTVVMNCVLPLGVDTMKRPKSVLIAGPRQSGKHLLAGAVFTATKCVLFDLSPEVIAGKYEGKKGMKMLVHLVSKMSRILQPSIVFVDKVERIFYKKVPASEKHLEPKRLGKTLFKGIVKPIQPADRVLVLGTTGQPWAANAKQLKKAFEKVILIPKPDYGSIMLWWRELLMPFHGVDRDFDVTSLTTATRCFPLSTLRDAVQEVLTPDRVIQLRTHPLRQAELFERLLHSPGPVTDKEYKKFAKWYNKTNLGKQRNALNKFFDKNREIAARQAEKVAAQAAKKK